MRIASAWVVLMKRLGYTRFVAQGGDWGAIVTSHGWRRDAQRSRRRSCSASTPTCRARFRPTSTGAPRPAARRRPVCPPRSKRAYEQLAFFYKHVGYAIMMGTRPQTLTGSRIPRRPGGLHARPRRRQLRADRPRRSTGEPRRPDARRRARQHHAVLADEHRASPRRALYWETRARVLRTPRTSPSRSAVSVFPDELYPGAAELGGAGVPEAHPLQRARQGRALRRVGAAAAALRRHPRDVPIAALETRIDSTVVQCASSSPTRASTRRAISSRVRPDLFERPALRVGQLPVDVALAGDVRAGVAAAHRHDDVGAFGEFARERLRATVGEVDAELGADASITSG